jgi:RNA polymerase sigma-70 factor (ECF subfamily)
MLAAMTEPYMPSNDVSPPDLAAICQRAREGDQRAFEALYRSTSSLVYGLCLRMTTNTTLAEECTQNTYVKAWQNLHQFRGESEITTWLHRIAVNEVLGNHRREKRHQHEEEQDLAERLHESTENVDLERAIARLPQQMRSVFILHGIYGYGHQETGTMLNIAEGTSKAHYHQARRLLMAALEGESEGETA